jgi:hypothetical protein
MASALRADILAQFTRGFCANARNGKHLSASTGIGAIRFAPAFFRDVLAIFTEFSAEISEISAENSDARVSHAG